MQNTEKSIQLLNNYIETSFQVFEEIQSSMIAVNQSVFHVQQFSRQWNCLDV